MEANRVLFPQELNTHWDNAARIQRTATITAAAIKDIKAEAVDAVHPTVNMVAEVLVAATTINNNIIMMNIINITNIKTLQINRKILIQTILQKLVMEEIVQ